MGKAGAGGHQVVEVERTIGPLEFVAGGALLFFGSATVPFFYMAFSEDMDVRYYGWRLIWIIISIFAAVFEFQTSNQVLKYYIGEGPASNIFLLLVFFGVLQAIIIKAESKLALLSYGLVLGHMTGFAISDVVIHHMHHWMEEDEIDVKSYAKFIALLLAVPVLYMGLCFGSGRVRLGMSATGTGRGEDMSVQKREHLGQHAEDDAMGVAMSVILCAIIRFNITDIFPNQEGDEQESDSQDPHHPVVPFLMLLLCVVFLGASLKLGAIAAHAHGEPGGGMGEFLKNRAISQANFTVTFLTAWLGVYGLQYIVQARFGWLGPHIVIRVITAGLMTYTVVPLIFVVDKFADNALAKGNKDLAAGLTNVIDAFGIAVAYAWERAFDRCFEDISIRVGQWYSGNVTDLFGLSSRKYGEISIEYSCDATCMKAKVWSAVLFSVAIVLAFFPLLRYHVTAAMENARMDAREDRGLSRQTIVQGH
jgi:hypothetical protein